MSLSRIDLNLLLVLHTVLRERNVARAAKRLNVTASAVSNALARLRVALDDPLTIRSGRGIVPTPRATELEPVLARALGELDRALSAREFEPSTCDRVFSLAVADVGQWARLPRVVRVLAREMPRARLRVLSIDTLHAAGGLAGSAADVLIGVGEPGPGIHLQPLYEEQVLLVARAGHPTAKARVSKKVLAGLKHVEVHVSPGRGSRPLAASYAELGIARDIAVFVPNFSAAAALVSNTDLVASLPGTLLETLAAPLGLRAVATPLHPVSAMINLVWHERTEADPALRAFRALVLRA
ncbi:MAG TPA: LysR substrate-binding domain-containing protein [Polyangiaceae bacterium]|nr:LysR substrate-binding domain-containing protein [Polyangiaceae bacterium]